jgi:hypothetical protein
LTIWTRAVTVTLLFVSKTSTESFEDGLASLSEQACAEPERAGDVVGVGVVKQQRDDRSVTVIQAGCQLSKPISRQGRKVPLPRGDAPDRRGRLFRFLVAPHHPVRFGDDRRSGQPLVNAVGIDEHARRVAQVLELMGKLKAVTGQERRGDQADTGLAFPGDSEGLLTTLDVRDQSDALLPGQQCPDAVAHPPPIVSDQHIDVAETPASVRPDRGPAPADGACRTWGD